MVSVSGFNGNNNRNSNGALNWQKLKVRGLNWQNWKLEDWNEKNVKVRGSVLHFCLKDIFTTNLKFI